MNISRTLSGKNITSHRPRKRFGQNFLQNPHVIQDILHVINTQATDKVVEIGPGLGALTQPLLQQLSQLTAIEIDTDLHAHLLAMPNASQKLNLIKGDALTIDYSQFEGKIRVVGNLPYNISTPLILHLLHHVASIEDMHFMLQKEVVERLAASPGCKDYGRLSVMVQYYCEVEHLFNVPPDAFYPAPKVDSAIVRLTPLPKDNYDFIEFHDLERLVACAFSMRRKTLANNLKPLMSATEIDALGIDPRKRPEQIDVVDYVQLAKFISK